MWPIRSATITQTAPAGSQLAGGTRAPFVLDTFTFLHARDFSPAETDAVGSLFLYCPVWHSALGAGTADGWAAGPPPWPCMVRVTFPRTRQRLWSPSVCLMVPN